MEKINNMDYRTLVNMLSNRISPDTRRQILIRLTDMNDQLLKSNDQISRSNDHNQYNQHNQHSQHSRYNTQPHNQHIYHNPQTHNQYNPSTHHNQYTNHQPHEKINLGNMIDNMCADNAVDELDITLDKIKKLHNKIIASKKYRKQNNVLV